MLPQLQQMLHTDNGKVSPLVPYRRTHCLPYHILLTVSALQGSLNQLLKHSNYCSPNKTNNAFTLAVSEFIQLQ